MASPSEKENKDVSVLLRQSMVHNVVAVRYGENESSPFNHVKTEFLDNSYSVIK